MGDLQKSVSLLAYKPVTGRIEEIARDYDCNWMTAIEMVDDESYLGAENSCNLFALKRSGESASEEDRSRLVKAGEFHVGDLINRFSKGSLVRDLLEKPGISSGEAFRDAVLNFASWPLPPEGWGARYARDSVDCWRDGWMEVGER